VLLLPKTNRPKAAPEIQPAVKQVMVQVKTRKTVVKQVRTLRTAAMQRETVLQPDQAPELSWLWGVENLLPYGGLSLMETALSKTNSRPSGKTSHD
jgi:hypothetical protein